MKKLLLLLPIIFLFSSNKKETPDDKLIGKWGLIERNVEYDAALDEDLHYIIKDDILTLIYDYEDLNAVYKYKRVSY